MRALSNLISVLRFFLLIGAFIISIFAMVYLMRHGHAWVFLAWLVFVIPGLVLPFFTPMWAFYVGVWSTIIVLSLCESYLERQIKREHEFGAEPNLGSINAKVLASSVAVWDAGPFLNAGGRIGLVSASLGGMYCSASKVRSPNGIEQFRESARIEWDAIVSCRFDDAEGVEEPFESKRRLIIDVGAPWFYFIVIGISSAEEESRWRSALDQFAPWSVSPE